MRIGSDPGGQRRPFESLFGGSADVFWAFSADWTEAILVNDAYEEVWGRPKDALGEDPTDFVEGVHPDDREAVRGAMARLSGGEPAEVEYRVNAEEGYRRWVWSRGQPVLDGADEVEWVTGVTREITERKRYEEDLRRRNERLDEFASTVSHDLRGPLSVAAGRVSLARAECEGRAEHLDAIGDAVQRMASIVDDTLTLARRDYSPDDFEWVDVDSADAELLVTEAFAVRCGPGHLQHVLGNLLRNALEHGDEAVTTVRVGPVDGSGFYVEDDAFGIPVENRERVFQPGHSTSEGGIGLGLTIVRRLADRHGWSVLVTDGEHGGARFEFRGVEVDTRA